MCKSGEYLMLSPLNMVGGHMHIFGLLTAINLNMRNDIGELDVGELLLSLLTLVLVKDQGEHIKVEKHVKVENRGFIHHFIHHHHI